MAGWVIDIHYIGVLVLQKAAILTRRAHCFFVDTFDYGKVVKMVNVNDNLWLYVS